MFTKRHLTKFYNFLKKLSIFSFKILKNGLWYKCQNKKHYFFKITSFSKQNKISLNLKEETANEVIKLEIERICRKILYNTAVYKGNESGTKGFINYLNSIGFDLV